MQAIMRLIKLYSVVMLNYRQELGDKAWSAIGDLFKDKRTLGFSFLTGFISGWEGDSSNFEKFIKEDLEKLNG